ncbi:hypothetical protein TRFO_36767 [Tritrichomonas foetus]|uniref:Protein kinase domain-containing protein n=1 Tax=Tritrichomonas foetus TaxID=1144522 RepID=A0A1J4JHG8_9EUKA|nr:hypothetical protein TRFO_36767 [Tritrichomonas foetus]|eukprot:OHS97051.1 hypothetical protein TRFO_36767 [Tritrichomonas foetus]
MTEGDQRGDQKVTRLNTDDDHGFYDLIGFSKIHHQKIQKKLERLQKVTSLTDNLQHDKPKYFLNEYTVISVQEDEKMDYFTIHSSEEEKCLTNYFSDKSIHLNTGEILYGIAEAMNYLHKNKILHGCLKCENILLDKNNKPKVANYGIRPLIKDYGGTIYGVKRIHNDDLIEFSDTDENEINPENKSSEKGSNDESSVENEIKKEDDKINSKTDKKNKHSRKNKRKSSREFATKLMQTTKRKKNSKKIKDEINGEIESNDYEIPNNITFEHIFDIYDFENTPYCPPELRNDIFHIENINSNDDYNLNDEKQSIDDYVKDNAKMDVFAYGILFYEVISRSRIKSFDELSTICGSVNPGKTHFPDSIQHLIRGCLSVDPNNRPSFSVILKMLQNIPSLNIEREQQSQFTNSEYVLFFEDEDFLHLNKKNLRIDIEFEKVKKKFSFKNDYICPSELTIPFSFFEVEIIDPTKKKILSESQPPKMIHDEMYITNDPNYFLIHGIIKFNKLLSNLLDNQSDEEEEALKEIFKLFKTATFFGSSDSNVLLGILKLLIFWNPTYFKINQHKHTTTDNKEELYKEIKGLFKESASCFNIYGMVNYGVYLQNEDRKFDAAGKAFLEAGDKGRSYYNHAIENGFIDDESNRQYNKAQSNWVDWFLTMPVGRIFVKAPQELISMSDKNSHIFQSKHDSVQNYLSNDNLHRNTKYDSANKTNNSDTNINIGKSDASITDDDFRVAQEYGSVIHAEFTKKESDFINEMLKKYVDTTDLPQCPRVFCYGQRCLPVGPLMTSNNNEITRELNKRMCVHFYCPRCNDFYLPSQTVYRNISSIYFPRNYLPNAILNLYMKGKVGQFVQFIPTIFGIPMMEALRDDHETNKIDYDKNDAVDEAGFFSPEKLK